MDLRALLLNKYQMSIIKNNLFMKTVLFIIIFLPGTATILSAQTNLPKNVQHLEIKRLNDSYIDAYLYNEHSGKKRPLLIFCQGSGYDSNTQGFLGLAAQFGKQVIGLVLEKQGVKYGDKGDSLAKSYTENNTVYNRLYDYLRVLQYLRANANWWNHEVYIVGGSEGGLLAGLLASFYPDTKGLAILCYGGGLKFGEAWPISSGLLKKAEGADSAAVKKEELIVKDSLDYIRQNATVTKSFSGDDNTYAWWASIVDLRLSNSLVDLNIPIFVGQGTEDMMAPPVSAKKLQQAFQQSGKKNFYLKEYEGYDHSFTDKEQKSHLVEVFMEAISWILKQK
jgi:dienelactone hydrolase